MVVQELVQAAIWQCLNHYNFADAVFLGERLHAEVDSDESLFTLATCYHRMGKPTRAYMLLRSRDNPTPQARYLMAQCCLELNRFVEAETAVAGAKARSVDDVVADFSDIACFALQLLGRVYAKTERRAKAVECFQRSLRLNPFLWSSYESLCRLGERPDAASTFQVNLQSIEAICQSVYPSPMAPGYASAVDSPNIAAVDPPSAARTPQPQSHGVHPKPVFSQSGNTNTGKDAPAPNPQQPANYPNNSTGLRRSTRLFSHASSSSVKENNKYQGENKLLSPRAPTKKSKTKLSYTPQQMNEKNKSKTMQNDGKPSTVTSVKMLQQQSANGLMQLLQEIAKAYQALSQYDCRHAVELFESLPPQHYNTGWVLCQVGRAYFELSEYQMAERVFSEVRRREPYHVESMEIYSTVLWHLQAEVQLSALAQDLTDVDKYSPHAWCATGNCFSLQKEHDIAIKFFQRAIQVDPEFAYAYTLLGHEYVLIEELDKALAAFRNAIRIDPRHYNAWYGVGMVYYKQEKFVLAEFHFGKALSINHQSSALLCHIGVVQHALKKSDVALRTLNRAIAIDPKNPLCKFHRASILFAGDRHPEALQELKELKELVPKESLVYFLIGKVYKKMGESHLALINFSWAMDLDPKGANNHIKEAIDKRYMAEDDDVANVSGTEAGAAGGDPLEGTSNASSLMEADDFQLRNDESL